jgi:hypothetical protein
MKMANFHDLINCQETQFVLPPKIDSMHHEKRLLFAIYSDIELPPIVYKNIQECIHKANFFHNFAVLTKNDGLEVKKPAVSDCLAKNVFKNWLELQSAYAKNTLEHDKFIAFTINYSKDLAAKYITINLLEKNWPTFFERICNEG